MLENVKMPDGINKDVMEHLMYPRNYGKLENPSCIGIAADDKTGEYVIFYTLLENNVIKDVKFATNGCQDTVVVGSMYTEMIKGQTTEFANKALGLIAKKLGSNMSRKQEICAEMVLNGFVASMMNYENLQNSKEEEAHILQMAESCEVEEENE